MPHNYQLSAQIVLKDIYRFLSLLAADAPLLEISEAEGDPLAVLRDWFLEDELVHGLVSIAVSNRVQLDHMEDDENGLDDHMCGDLQEDVVQGGWIDLTFREACNKIIHAVHIVPVRDMDADPAQRPLTHEIKLRGTKGAHSWQAKLDMVRFARASVKNFQRLR